jgi:ankyrin repeat protein
MDGQEKWNARLRQAAERGDLSALVQALDGGADALKGDSLALRWAAAAGHVDCVRLLIPVSDPLAWDSYALRAAAGNGYARCVELLIPASDAKAEDSWALRRAAEEGRTECVKLLIPASDPLAKRVGSLDAAGLARKNGHVEVAAMIEAFIEAGALSDCAQKAKSGPRVKSAL